MFTLFRDVAQPNYFLPQPAWHHHLIVNYILFRQLETTNEGVFPYL
jgi:hypothetical protein